jgi:hypothetical protein
MAYLETEPTAFVARIFFDGKGVEVHEPFKGREGEPGVRRFTFWFNEAVTFDLGATGTFRGVESSKVDHWTNQDGTPKLDLDRKPVITVAKQANASTFTPSGPAKAPAAPITDDTPF